MALSDQDAVLEKSTTTGTGPYTLSGSPGITGFNVNDYLTFSGVGNGNTVRYTAVGVDPTTGIPNNTGREWGLGTYTASGTSLARTAIYGSTNSGSAVSWGAGTRFIFCTPLAEGTLVARQPGGTVGISQIEISHDGTDSYLLTRTGDINCVGSNLNALSSVGGAYANIHALRLFLLSGGVLPIAFWSDTPSVELGSTCPILWANTSSSLQPKDVGIIRASANVVKITNGSTGFGWLQTAGEAALASDFTKSNATLSNTNLSLLLIAGRSYRIEGYFIISNSTTTEGSQFDFNGGTATATTFDVAFNAIGSVTPGTVASTSLAGNLNYTVVTGTDRIFVRGYIKVNGGGTFILRAAENTTALGTFTLAAGSWLAAYDTVNL